MHKDGDEEHRVEVWYGRCGADAKTPCEALNPVGGVVLAEIRIKQCDKKITVRVSLTGLRAYAHQPLVRRRLLYMRHVKTFKLHREGKDGKNEPMSSLDVRRVLDRTPG